MIDSRVLEHLIRVQRDAGSSRALNPRHRAPPYRPFRKCAKMPDVTLVTRDSVRLQFDCNENENLLDAAAAAGLFLPAMCREGTCGLCRAEVADGTYEMGGHST